MDEDEIKMRFGDDIQKIPEAWANFTINWEKLIQDWRTYCEEVLDIPSQIVISDPEIEHLRHHLLAGELICTCHRKTNGLIQGSY